MTKRRQLASALFIARYSINRYTGLFMTHVINQKELLRSSVPPRPIFAHLLVGRVERNKPLARRAPACLAFENTSYSASANITETVETTNTSRVDSVDSGPFRRSVWAAAITQVCPARHYDGVFELCDLVGGIFDQTCFYQVLRWAFGTSPCRSTFVAPSHDEVGVCSCFAEDKTSLNLLVVGIWWRGNV